MKFKVTARTNLIKRIQQRYLIGMVNKLSEIGERTITSQIMHAKWGVITGNLLDSYGYCIYVDGKIAKEWYFNPTPIATEPNDTWEEPFTPAVYGRDQIEKLFHNDYKPKSRIELVCAVSMPYNIYKEVSNGAMWQTYGLMEWNMEQESKSIPNAIFVKIHKTDGKDSPTSVPF